MQHRLLLQEIYPPKIAELAFVTDGACLEEEILQMELIMLKVGKVSSHFFIPCVFEIIKVFILDISVFFSHPLEGAI